MSDAESPLVFETPGGLSVSYKGRLLYSAREPRNLPRKVAAACDSGPSRLHLVLSPLLWYGVPEILAAMGPGSAVLCVEADHALAEIARSRMPSELAGDERLAFLETSSPAEAVDAAKALGAFRACSVVAASGGDILNEGAYRDMAATLSAEFESAWRNRATLMVLGDRWAKNIFDNLAAMPSIAPEPLSSFPGAVVVCGAGPSLEAALGFIARARARLGVVACDTALGTLLSAGIEPDLVVCLEGQAHNLADFTCLGSNPVALAADLSSHPVPLRAVRGRKHLTLVRITRSLFLSRIEAALSEAGIPFLPSPPLGSVGVHAARVARRLGGGPILATGLDFSFEPGKTHARGCPSLLAEEARLDRLTRWPGQYAASFRERMVRPAGARGGTLSDPVLVSYAALLADGFARGEEAEEAGPALYDLRGRGLSIGGRAIDLEEAESLVAGSHGRDGPGIPAPFDGVSAARAMSVFLKGEIGRLDELRMCMRGIGSMDEASFRGRLLESDYLFWAFPDQDRVRDLPQDFLNRIRGQVEYWSNRLEALVVDY